MVRFPIYTFADHLRAQAAAPRSNRPGQSSASGPAADVYRPMSPMMALSTQARQHSGQALTRPLGTAQKLLAAAQNRALGQMPAPPAVPQPDDRVSPW